MTLRRSIAAALLVAPLLLLAGPASAHTDSDLVAVPAGSAAKVTLEPTHGCGGAATTKVSTRVPVAGATAGPVAGWTATATPDGDRTVIEWTGGSLPADQTGAFPVSFTAPDRVGELLLFPFVQECANGEELSWISGDPESDNPAPRLLVLAAGSEPAETIDEVPADAPGRAQLTQVVDVDNPAAEITSTTAATTSTSASPSTTAEAEQDDSSGFPFVALVVAVVVAALATVQVRRRRR